MQLGRSFDASFSLLQAGLEVGSQLRGAQRKGVEIRFACPLCKWRFLGWGCVCVCETSYVMTDGLATKLLAGWLPTQVPAQRGGLCVALTSVPADVPATPQALDISPQVFWLHLGCSDLLLSKLPWGCFQASDSENLLLHQAQPSPGLCAVCRPRTLKLDLHQAQ